MRFSDFFQIESDRINAPSLVRRDVISLARKYVAEVGIAVGTTDLCADSRGQRSVLNQLYGIVGCRGIERRPSAS
jgi:hypothetical protein